MLKERLKEALDNKKAEMEISKYYWKGKKIKVDGVITQEKIKLIDASQEQLVTFNNYCKTMLFNTSKTDPGRYLVLDIANDQINRCAVELFLRSLENSENRIPRYTLYEKLQEEIKNSGVDPKTLKISDVTKGCPVEFENLPLNLVIAGCLDALGTHSKRHTPLKFIIKKGIWFSKLDLEELKEEGKEPLEVAKEKLGIYKDTELKISSQGVPYQALKAIVTIKNKKYSEMTDEQLTVLRERILLNLKKEVSNHIKQWEERMRQIDAVAKYRGLTLE
jgi:hypothetical protein